ncbi:MAG: YpmA family protein [Peptococcaceae bacterium]|nr:YpmA family protein [Peptococcaceae bacterium]
MLGCLCRRLAVNNNDTGKLELIAVKSFKNYDEMYKVVNFLNKTLKDRKLIFGLTRDSANGTVTISIYES